MTHKNEFEYSIDKLNSLLAQKPQDEFRFMEVCGTHTVSLFRSGIKTMLPNAIKLISGPGCPVCVTCSGYLDAAIDLARRGVTICTYGDMIRVPGTGESLAQARAKGATIKLVYSAHDALKYAQKHPKEDVVFLAVGFETTTPATAITLLQAAEAKTQNFSLLVAHKVVLPAMLALLSGGDVPLDGFICPGHVSVIIGLDAYQPIVENFRKPCVVAGFEPPSMLEAIYKLVEQKLTNEAKLDNAYHAVVSHKGNIHARSLIHKVFEPCSAAWRSLGTIEESGLALRAEYESFDAAKRYQINTLDEDEHPDGCICGEVIQGKASPIECSLFKKACTPAHPIGPCMVSSEGTCAAWFKYNRD